MKNIPIEVKDAVPVVIYYTSSNKDGERVMSGTDDHTILMFSPSEEINSNYTKLIQKKRVKVGVYPAHRSI